VLDGNLFSPSVSCQLNCAANNWQRLFFSSSMIEDSMARAKTTGQTTLNRVLNDMLMDRTNDLGFTSMCTSSLGGGAVQARFVTCVVQQQCCRVWPCVLHIAPKPPSLSPHFSFPPSPIEFPKRPYGLSLSLSLSL
jgi:hypothetical protein